MIAATILPVMRTVPLIGLVDLSKPKPGSRRVPIPRGKSAMQSRKLRILSAVTAGSLMLAVVAITASAGTSQTARYTALAARAESFPPVDLDKCPTLWTGYPQGGCVAQLQTDLRIVQDPNLAVDGIFGSVHSQTYNAVIAFQKAHGLPQDDMVGPDTKSALKAALAGSGPASPVDHYTVELKAWIPQATVTGPHPDS